MTEAGYSPQEYLLDDSELLVLRGDRAGNFVYANPAYLKVSGYTWEELKGTKSRKMLHPDLPPQIYKDMVNTVARKQPWTGIIKNQRKNGDYYWIRLNLSPLYAEREFTGSLMVHSKISPEEINKFDQLYKRMSSAQNKNLTLRYGRVVHLNFWTKIIERVRKFGLNANIWGAIGAMGIAGLICCVQAASSEVYSLSFWSALCGIFVAACLAGYYLSRQIVAPLREAMQVANWIAAGDLRLQMASKGNDEIDGVMRALIQMNMNMRATVLDIRDGVDLMHGATAEIAAGTMDLSSRTDNQASNLQETASAMEEINAMVKSNADIARQASQFASSACVAAEAGGKVVGEVISTMEGIARSSKKISEIITVIDGIAFQTNLLALNAAVEAARAGEHGRGFAVVAGEVRNLAQRSAQAAREIKTLISDSGNEVDNGSRLVNSAGEAIGSVVSQVQRVTELVGHLASASAKQSLAIAEVNMGIANLDQMTQQNAALVEQSTAASESLNSQAERLSETVSVFKFSS